MAQNLGTAMREAGVVFTKLEPIEIPKPKVTGPVLGDPLRAMKDRLIIRKVRQQIAEEKNGQGHLS